MTINHGLLVTVELPDFAGEAGLVDRPGRASLCYRPNRDGAVVPGLRFDANGRKWTVESVAWSSYARGFREIELRLVDEAG